MTGGADFDWSGESHQRDSRAKGKLGGIAVRDEKCLGKSGKDIYVNDGFGPAHRAHAE